MTSPMPTDHEEPKGMTYLQHGWEKCKRQPLVPIGAAATTVALLGATASLRSGNRRQFQNFLRLRVAAQGATVVAMVVGAYMLTEKAEEAKDTRERARTGQLPREAGSKVAEPAVVTATRRPEDTDQAYDHLYPTRTKTKVSDFTRRLRAAEEQQAADDDASAASGGSLARTKQLAAARNDKTADEVAKDAK